MKIRKITCLALIFCSLSNLGCAITKPTLRAEFSVFDAISGEPLEDVKVSTTFAGGLPKDDQDAVAFTNKNGKAKLTGQTSFPFNYRCTKDGYYVSKDRSHSWKSRDSYKNFFVDLDFAIGLRPVVAPQPLVARKKMFTIPEPNEWVGFDLEASDWVKPNGMGVSSDLLIYYEKEFLGYRISDEGREKVRARRARTGQEWTDDMEKEIYGNWSGSLRIGFPDEDEGIIEIVSEYDPYSAMCMPYEAPESGYQSSAEWIDVTNNEAEKPESKGYFLRVRVVKRGDEIIKANYAKINEGIHFNPDRNRFTLSYCFNPDVNDRNLEFDPSKNLLTLKSVGEQVRLP